MKHKIKGHKENNDSQQITLKPKRTQKFPETNQDFKIYENLNPIFTQKLREHEDIVQRLLETKKKFLSSQHNPEIIKEFSDLKFDNDSDLVVISGKVVINNEELIYEKLKDPIYTENEIVNCAFCGLSSKDTKYYENLGEIYGPYYSKKQEDPIFAHDQCILWTSGLYFNANNSVKAVIFKSVSDAEKNVCKLCHKTGASLHCAETQCRRQYHLPCLLYKENKCQLLPYSFEIRCENHKDSSSESYVQSNDSEHQHHHPEKEFSLVIECKHKNLQNFQFDRMLKQEKMKKYCILCGYRVFQKNIELTVQCSLCKNIFHEQCVMDILKIKKIDKTCYKCFNCLKKSGNKAIKNKV